MRVPVRSERETHSDKKIVLFHGSFAFTFLSHTAHGNEHSSTWLNMIFSYENACFSNHHEIIGKVIGAAIARGMNFYCLPVDRMRKLIADQYSHETFSCIQYI